MVDVEKKGEILEDFESDFSALQNKLASRLLLVFSIPLLIIIVLGVYGFQISSRLVELEVLKDIIQIEADVRKNKNYIGAIDAYKRLAVRHQDPRILGRLGSLYIRSGMSDKAEDVLTTAVGMDGDTSFAHAALTYFYVIGNEHEKAVTVGEATLKLKPFDAQTLNNLAWVYATTGDERIHDIDRAVEYAQRAVGFTLEQQVPYLDTLAVAKRNQGRHSEAQEIINKALKLEPKNVALIRTRNSIRDALENQGQQ